MKFLRRAAHGVWYGKNRRWRFVLCPFSAVYYFAIGLRRLYFSWRPAAPLPVPIMVVGNLTVGGAGKTPAVIGILELLSRHGFSPAVISRGYGAKKTVRKARAVAADSSPQELGDEPVLLAQRGSWPVVVAANRYRAACHVLKHYAVDVIVADDGLQHYRLPRTVEIAVVDGRRRFGNGFLLPAGPLREPLSRLDRIDCLIVKGEARNDECAMTIHPKAFIRLSDGASRPADYFCGRTVAAYAGIAHPDGFFSTLERLGVTVDPHPLPDHYSYKRDDCLKMARQPGPLIMTEKDAVKCKAFIKQGQDAWFLQMDTVFAPKLKQRLLSLMSDKL